MVETYFSTNASFRVVETDFLASTNDKLFFRLTNLSFQLLEKDFLLVEIVYFTWEIFPTSQNRHWYERKHFLKTDLILPIGNSFSS